MRLLILFWACYYYIPVHFYEVKVTSLKLFMNKRPQIVFIKLKKELTLIRYFLSCRIFVIKID
jgi:hypothetical protein